MDESDILRRALKTFIEVQLNRLESEAKEKGKEFNIDDFIVEVVLVELASNSWSWVVRHTGEVSSLFYKNLQELIEVDTTL